jgi:hypothetical protein
LAESWSLNDINWRNFDILWLLYPYCPHSGLNHWPNSEER